MRYLFDTNILVLYVRNHPIADYIHRTHSPFDNQN